MIRVEWTATDPYSKNESHGVFCESTMHDAKMYIFAMRDNGVNITKAEYFDKDKREADIAAGRVK